MLIFIRWQIHFLIKQVHPFKSVGDWKLAIIASWVIGEYWYVKMDLGFSPSPLQIIERTGWKMHHLSCATTHQDFTDVEVSGLVWIRKICTALRVCGISLTRIFSYCPTTGIWESGKTLILEYFTQCQERSMILHDRTCLRWYTLRSYNNFKAKVTWKRYVEIWKVRILNSVLIRQYLSQGKPLLW